MSESPKVTVRFGRSSQRRHHRLTAPLEVVLQGEPCTTTDWSAGGMRCRLAQTTQLKQGDDVPVTLCVPFQDFRVSVDARARVVRMADDSADVALQFIDLQPRARELLYYFSENLLRGEMAQIDGAIKRIDLPVTPPPPHPPQPPAGGEANKRGRRAWLIGGSYAAVATVLTAWLGYALYKALFVISAEQAMVYAPTVDMIGPDDGVVDAVYVREGDQVAAGDSLVDLSSTRLAQQLTEARIQERQAKIDIEHIGELIAQEKKTLLPYGAMAVDQLNAANARLQSAQKYLDLTGRQHSRMIALLKEGYVSTQELDKVESNLAMAQGAVSVARSELQVARTAELAARTGRYYTSNRLEGRLPELESDLIAARQKEALASTRVQELEAQAGQLSLRAPVAGRVRQLPVVAGSVVNGGSLVISLQTDERPRVYAVVSSARLERVTIGRRASVYVPAIGRDLDAEVIAIEPRIWTLPENVRRLLGNPADAGLVVLNFEPEPAEGAAFNPGLPVLVEVGGLRDSRGFRWMAAVFGESQPPRLSASCVPAAEANQATDRSTICPPDATRS